MKNVKMDTIVISSENLITNRKARDMIGQANLVDSTKETLSIINDGLKRQNNGSTSIDCDGIIEGKQHKFESVGPFEDKFTIEYQDAHEGITNGSSPPPENANELQLNVKLFLREYNQEVASEAINYLVSRLGAKVIDNMYVTVPANVIAHIGLTSQWSVIEAETTSTSDTDSGTPRKETASDEVELDPEKTKYAEDMISLWNTLGKIKQVQSLGLCDVETDIFKKIYNDVQIKPKNVQVNLKSCCVVPPDLKEFANINNIKLLTHSDSPEILGDSFCSEINEGKDNDNKWKPLWIIRFQVFKKMRGVLQDKRYMIALERN